MLSISTLQAQDHNEFIDWIQQKSIQLEQEKEKYDTYLALENKEFQRQEMDRKMNMHVIYRPNLQHIKATLAYFYIRMKENPERCYYYLHSGIALSSDYINRQRFVLYLKDNPSSLCPDLSTKYSVDWNYLIAISGTTKWANNYIDSVTHLELEKNYENSLYYLIINHWADSLHRSNKIKAYNYVKRLYNKGPSNGEGERFFRLFYRLKPKETQKELLECWNRDNGIYNLYIAFLLSDFTIENKEVANKLKKIISDCEYGDCVDLKNYLNTALFFLHPIQGKKDFLASLKKEISGEESIEEQYSDCNKILKKFLADSSNVSDHLSILTDYVKSKPLDTFGDIHRYQIVKAIYKKTPKDFAKLITELKENGKGIYHVEHMLQWAKNDSLIK